MDAGPSQFETLCLQRFLEIAEKTLVVPNRARGSLPLKNVCSECAGSFADVPFDRVEPIAAVRDVGGAYVLTCGQKIFDTSRKKCA